MSAWPPAYESDAGPAAGGATAHEEPLAWRILRALAEGTPAHGGEGDTGMSLPRLGKRLGQGVSVLMRELAHLGDATVGGQRGPGWVRVVQAEGRWRVHLTAEGLGAARQLPGVKGAP